MSDSARYRITAEHLDAIRRDGTIARDLDIADWMQRSRPHGEYHASTGSFAVRSTRGDAMPVGGTDWVVRIGTRFVPCSTELFDALTQQDTPVLRGECRDPFPPGEPYPAPNGQELCVDCILELELSEPTLDQALDRNARSVVVEQAERSR